MTREEFEKAKAALAPLGEYRELIGNTSRLLIASVTLVVDQVDAPIRALELTGVALEHDASLSIHRSFLNARQARLEITFTRPLEREDILRHFEGCRP